MTSAVHVRRFAGNPVIRPDMLPGTDGLNINGPSLIRVPPWIVSPLGRYYLYFAHHGGTFIRLATADALEGPWTVFAPGTLALEAAPGCRGHIASPDVHVDEKGRRLLLYFHGPASAGGGQRTFVATSNDGLAFTASDQSVGIFYMRMVRWNDRWYGMAKGGLLYRSADGLSGFEAGHSVFPGAGSGERSFNAPGDVRHVALDLRGDTLWVYFTRIGDAPERILRAPVALGPDWSTWRADRIEEVLRPETDYEGADLPVRPSVAGAARGREHAVRDPAVFREEGRTYLLYSVAGESGLAMAEVLEP